MFQTSYKTLVASYGRSTNDINEFIHKETRNAFGNTKKRPDLIQEQLLINRISSAIYGYSESEC